jgi:hypothetical protein
MGLEKVWGFMKKLVNHTNKRFKEILRLKSMLDEANIPYECRCANSGYIIHYPEWEHCYCSAIEHMYSYGCKEDLIEIMGLLTDSEKETDSVVGFLTADDVFSRIKAREEIRKHNKDVILSILSKERED